MPVHATLGKALLAWGQDGAEPSRPGQRRASRTDTALDSLQSAAGVCGNTELRSRNKEADAWLTFVATPMLDVADPHGAD